MPPITDMAFLGLPLILPLPVFYFIFKHHARAYQGYTKAQRAVTLIGLVLYIIGALMFALSWIVLWWAGY